MSFTELADDPEDAPHSPAERAATASRSHWVTSLVGVLAEIRQRAAA
jgi:hypothetical protein